METDGLPSNTLLNGHVRIDRVLGQGGFAITYLAFDTRLERAMAVKELFLEGCSRVDHDVRPNRTISDSFRLTIDRFVAEARTLASVHHENIVGVFDVFEENGSAYIAMEYIDGETLEERVDRTGPLSPDEVRHITGELLNALDYVHQKGMLHRDVKPSNVMIDRRGRVALIDFGAARNFQSQVSVQTKLVSMGYSPIEQFGSAPLSPAADIYALAATAFFLLKGSAPPPSTERAGGSSTLPATESISYDLPLARAVVCGLSMMAAERPQTAAAFRAMLTSGPIDSIEAQPIGTKTQLLSDPAHYSSYQVLTSPPREEVQQPKAGTSRALIAVLGLAVVALIGLIAVLLGSSDTVAMKSNTNDAESIPSTNASRTEPSASGSQSDSANASPAQEPNQPISNPPATTVALETTQAETTPQEPSVVATTAASFVRGIVEGTNGVDNITNKNGEGFLSVRSSPNSGASEMDRIFEGEAITVICQVRGSTARSSKHGSSNVWDRLENGGYVAHVYVEGIGSRYSVTLPCV